MQGGCTHFNPPKIKILGGNILVDNKIVIKETSKDDLENVMKLWNNGDVMKFVGFPDGLGITIENLEKWIIWAIQPPYRCHYSIYLEDDTYCGETFYDTDVNTGTSALDIKLLSHVQGKGIAFKALSYSINKAFKEGKAERVYVDPHPDNISAWKLYEKLKFTNRPRPDYLEGNNPYLEITRDEWQKTVVEGQLFNDFKVEVNFKDIILRDYIITDIEDDIRWMTTEIEWHDWDAPWEAEKDLLKFNSDEFREKQIKRLNTVRSSGILRTSFEICTKDDVHIGGCNSYLIDDKYKWIPNTKGNKGYRTLGISICEKSYWNKGFGTQALVAFINYYIDHGINEIYTQTWSGNYRMVNLAKRLGFVECECLENSVLVRGNMYDGLTFKLDIDRYKDFYSISYILEM